MIEAYLSYLAAPLLMLAGAYAILAKDNLIKKVMGLMVFTNGLHLLLITLGYRAGGIAPILTGLDIERFSATAVDPLPQALVLTSIVISLSVTALALSLTVQVHRKAGTLAASRLGR